MSQNVQPVGLRRVLAVILCGLVVIECAIAGQSDVGLRVLVVEGLGAQNVVDQITPKPVAVRVVDRNNRPVADATVVFTVPETGPSGVFVNGSNSIIVFSDQEGLAAGQQYRPNSVIGTYQIQVRASYMGEAATVAIRQSNVGTAKKSFGKMIAILAVAGGAAGVAMAARGGGSGGSGSGATTPPITTPTIVFGGSTVGAPR